MFNNLIRQENILDYNTIEFNSIFTEVFSYTFTNESEQKKIHLPNDSMQQSCIFCGNCGPLVTFQKISHILPQSLGNHHLTYNNECDICNEKFGQILEQDLINYISAIRAISRKKGKKLIQKYKYGRNKNYIISNTTNKVEIYTYPDDDSIKITLNESNKTGTIDIQVPPVNFVAVAKSLVRIALMCLPYNEAINKKNLVDWINDKYKFLPIFYRAFIPGSGLLHTSITLYKNTKNIIGYGEYFIALFYSNYCYYFQIPNNSMINATNIILPPFLKQYEGGLKIRTISPKADEKEKVSNVFFEIKYKDKNDIILP